MGFSTETFVLEVDANLTCPICYDVFSHPRSITPCGHTFCTSCLPESIEKCPSCRVEIQVKPPSFALKGLIDNLLVHCRNNNHHRNDRTCEEPPPSNRRRLDHCNWQGKLPDWQQHAKECSLPVGSCQVPGCDFVGSLKGLEEHDKESMQRHYQLMLEAQQQSFDKLKEELREKSERQKKSIEQLRVQLKKEAEKQIESLEQLKQDIKKQDAKRQESLDSLREEIRNEAVKSSKQEKQEIAIDRMIGNFCRGWILKKPDPLFDFVVCR